MTRKLTLTLVALICSSLALWSQTTKTNSKKPSTTQSNAEKMGYARTNKYWGPGTYYSCAPGVPVAKMINTQLSAMRDFTGISREDCITELAKQGFTAIPQKEIQKWYGDPKNKDIQYYYSPDKSYILKPEFTNMEKSVAVNYTPYATSAIVRYVLVPKEDSNKVMDMVWQFMRDLKEMKVLLSTFGSTFKKADPKAFPIQQAGSSGWTSMRAGTFVLRVIDVKPVGAWDSNEAIVRRTIGNPEFNLRVLGVEPDFGYTIHVTLKKEGYFIECEVYAANFSTLEPSFNWADEHKKNVQEFTTGETMDKQAIDLYKKAPLPPVLLDFKTLLHTK